MRVLLDNRSLGERVPKRDLFVMPWCCPVRKSIELRELLIAKLIIPWGIVNGFATKSP